VYLYPHLISEHGDTDAIAIDEHWMQCSCCSLGCSVANVPLCQSK